MENQFNLKLLYKMLWNFFLGILFNQICFWTWFWNSGRAQTQKHMKVKVQVFFFRALHKVQNMFWKQIWFKSIPNYKTKFFSRTFWSIMKKRNKMDFPLYFKILILIWPKVFFKIDHWCSWVFGPYCIGKSPCTTCRLTFEFWSIIVRPYCDSKTSNQ